MVSFATHIVVYLELPSFVSARPAKFAVCATVVTIHIPGNSFPHLQKRDEDTVRKIWQEGLTAKNHGEELVSLYLPFRLFFQFIAFPLYISWTSRFGSMSSPASYYSEGSSSRRMVVAENTSTGDVIGCIAMVIPSL